MHSNVLIKPQGPDKRKEKERKREEKELRKIAAANGMKLPRTTQMVTDSNNVDVDVMRTEMPEKNGGGPSTPLNVPSSPSRGFRKSGWTAVGAVATPQPPSTPPPLPSSNLPLPLPKFTLHETLSRNGGWTTLDTPNTSAPFA